jgi:hypothetical protein
VFGWLQADTVAAVWIAAAAIHREKNTVEAAAAAGLQPQQAAANKLVTIILSRGLPSKDIYSTVDSLDLTSTMLLSSLIQFPRTKSDTLAISEQVGSLLGYLPLLSKIK